MIQEAQIRKAYELTRNAWGGATINSTTGEFVPDGIDAYAVSMKRHGETSISVPEDSSYALFSHAVHCAMYRWADAEYLGIFHDYDHKIVQVDPVAVVGTTSEVDALYQASPTSGGAYHFATGDGYWPAQ